MPFAGVFRLSIRVIRRRKPRGPLIVVGPMVLVLTGVGKPGLARARRLKRGVKLARLNQVPQFREGDRSLLELHATLDPSGGQTCIQGMHQWQRSNRTLTGLCGLLLPPAPSLRQAESTDLLTAWSRGARGPSHGKPTHPLPCHIHGQPSC